MSVYFLGIFSYYQERKSSKIMESFGKMVPHFAVVLRDGNYQNINSEDLVLGDIIQIKLGDRIAADIRLIECRGLKVDHSALTGESKPVPRSTEYTHENPLDTKNLAFFSTCAVEGIGRGVVIGRGDKTVMGRIARLTAKLGKRETPISKEIKHFINIITGFAVFVGLTFFIIAFIMKYFWIDAVIFLIGKLYFKSNISDRSNFIKKSVVYIFIYTKNI